MITETKKNTENKLINYVILLKNDSNTLKYIIQNYIEKEMYHGVFAQKKRKKKH